MIDKLFEDPGIQKYQSACNTDSNGHCYIISKIKYNYYHIFRIIKHGSVYYYVININIFIGNGCYGSVYRGYNVQTNEIIVGKYGTIGPVEATCLKQTGQYIAHMPHIILMKEALGQNYDQILKNKHISDCKKIELNEQIIKKYKELQDKYLISHMDTKPEHIFFHDIHGITFIDFGLSFYPIWESTYLDVTRFCICTRKISNKYCGNEFKKYIEDKCQINQSLNINLNIDPCFTSHVSSIFVLVGFTIMLSSLIVNKIINNALLKIK